MNAEEFQIHMVTEMAIMKTHILSLVGNGQPGKITRIENAILSHDRSLNRAKGWVAGAFGALSVALGIIEWYFHFRGGSH